MPSPGCARLIGGDHIRCKVRSGLLAHLFILRVAAGCKNDTVLGGDFVLVADFIRGGDANDAAFVIDDDVIDSQAELKADILLDRVVIQRRN